MRRQVLCDIKFNRPRQGYIFFHDMLSLLIVPNNLNGYLVPCRPGELGHLRCPHLSNAMVEWEIQAAGSASLLTFEAPNASAMLINQSTRQHFGYGKIPYRDDEAVNGRARLI